ncbi:hypothetical protein CEXT_728571 [Caerostris extrusa]|uniref:Uncharacterized protein n=1 Tax=Caerostris extrusa TaxID=172846 RepID=A0AAV4WM44_CAEEX|nr:hypothetical protein CEXT_728571 [Caerostris extrusa]
MENKGHSKSGVSNIALHFYRRQHKMRERREEKKTKCRRRQRIEEDFQKRTRIYACWAVAEFWRPYINSSASARAAGFSSGRIIIACVLGICNRSALEILRAKLRESQFACEVGETINDLLVVQGGDFPRLNF